MAEFIGTLIFGYDSPWLITYLRVVGSLWFSLFTVLVVAFVVARLGLLSGFKTGGYVNEQPKGRRGVLRDPGSFYLDKD